MQRIVPYLERRRGEERKGKEKRDKRERESRVGIISLCMGKE